MRDGLNPGKASPPLPAYTNHRVIVPTYIPSLDGYFARALDILRFTLLSLRWSGGPSVGITVVSNGCTATVIDALREWQNEGWLDQLVLNAGNRGKVDAVTSTARSAFEPLITIADADVMFMPGWLQAIEKIFIRFPECAFVSPCPNPAASQTHTSATILSGLARRETAYRKVVPAEDLHRFAVSLGRADWFNPRHLRAQLIVERQGTVACVGGGHFVFTIRREVVDAIPKDPSLQALTVGTEFRWLDEPPDRIGLWKLSTPRAFAYHLGNVPEPWMDEALERCRTAPWKPPDGLPLPKLRRRWVTRVPWAIRPRLAYKLDEVHRWWATRRAVPTPPASNSAQTDDRIACHPNDLRS